ncbi:MAG: hypothetical protein NTW93_07660 [Phycisphaerae bacterium]|nr:hypothetical protein [Phycisphaerae bacterium]
MNRAQKVAWLFVITISLAVVSSLAAFAILYIKVGIPKAFAGFALLGIAGFGGFGPIVFPKDKGKITCDERDTFIDRQAAIAGFATAFLVVGLACMLPFFILGPQATVAVWWLPNIFGAAGLATFFVHSVVILVLYGRGGGNGEK